VLDLDLFERLVAGHDERCLAVAATAQGEIETWLLGRQDERPMAIGSITKVLTGLLLAKLACDGVVSLDEALGTLIPDVTGAADPGVPAITLRSLASHTSGLPGEPPSLVAAIDTEASLEANPYAAYAMADLIRDLSAAELGPPTYSYSNFGFFALGKALERAGGMAFADLLRGQVFDPLGLTDTAAWNALDDELVQPGHDEGGGVVPRWTENLLGAGGLWSTGPDLGRFLAAVASRDTDPSMARALETATALSVEVAPDSRVHVGLGWHGTSSLRWHNGASAGFQSFCAIDVETTNGIAVVANWLDRQRSAEAAARALFGIPGSAHHWTLD
jgi:CubicO group peptidase (beta-lactamase class C family)